MDLTIVRLAWIMKNWGIPLFKNGGKATVSLTDTLIFKFVFPSVLIDEYKVKIV